MSEIDIYYGEVIWFSSARGIGFIAWSNEEGVAQKDMFVHFSDINCEGFKTLYKHQKVSFNIGQNKHGQPKAINVQILKN